MSLSRMRTRSAPNIDEQIDDLNDLSRSSRSLQLEQTSLTKKVLTASLQEQWEMFKANFVTTWVNNQPTDVQLRAAVALANSENTFLLSATGSGKSRVSELFFLMFPKVKKAVIMVLNPLDALGDNQVLEKQICGITAINLTKNTFTKQVLKKLQKHEYSFIYLSPEIFLNSESFQTLYHSKEFQSHLVLKVVDEAHCIYLWGLQESGASKHFSVHVTPQDVGFFRPAYGFLGKQLMATINIPFLLMSATCRPIAVSSIMKSLSTTSSHITMIEGELARPELRFIRIYMTSTLDSVEDLNVLIPHESNVSHEELTPMIIYSGTRNGTLTVMQVVSKARGQPDEYKNPRSRLIRRYHSVTGDKDKLTHAEEYGKGIYPIISATSAVVIQSYLKL